MKQQVSRKLGASQSSDFKELVRYSNATNDNALRNALSRLGWESTRQRFAGKQQRVWSKKEILIEHGRIESVGLAATLDGAVDNGYVWFPIEYYFETTWAALRDKKLKPKFKADEKTSAFDDNKNGENGPFLDSTSHHRYQTWRNDKDMLDKKFLKHDGT